MSTNEIQALLHEIEALAVANGLNAWVGKGLHENHATESFEVEFRNFEELFLIGAVLHDYAKQLGTPVIDKHKDDAYVAMFKW